MVFLLADTQPPVDRATTTAIGDLRQIAALLEGLRALGSGRVLDDVLSLVLDSAIEVSGAERGFIMLALESVDLEFKMARGRGHITLSGGSFATSRKIPEEVFRTGEPRIVADLLDGDLANVHMGTVALGIRNVLCVPLRLVRYVDKAENVGEERRIGVLYLDSKEKGSLLSGSTRAALETLATEAAVAIENARLYRETMEKARMEQEMRIAAEIQQALLPKAARAGSYFRAAAASLPCRSIGGDFYDYVEMSDGSLGLRARRRGGEGPAGGAAQRDDAGDLRGAGGDQRRPVEDDHPGEPGAVSPRHRIAVRHADVRRARFRPATWSTATPATIRRSSSAPSGVRRLERGGPIVGLFEGATYEEERLTLSPGDWLIVFSDGISEAMSATGDEYGEARIIDVRPAQQGARSGAPARRAVQRRARLRARRGAERRHHGDGAALRPGMTLVRARRLAVALWLVMAVVVWNGLYDLRITLGVRDYLMKQALHDAGRGPAVTIAEAMQRRRSGTPCMVASLWASIILGAGLVTVRMLGPSRPHGLKTRAT